MNECNKIHKENVALENKVRCLEEAQRILKEKLRARERFEEDAVNDPKPVNAQAGEEVPVPVGGYVTGGIKPQQAGKAEPLRGVSPRT